MPPRDRARRARLRSLVTAVPPHRFAQAEARAQAAVLFEGAFPDLERRLAIFDHAGIDWRHACLPLEAQLEPRGFAKRNALFVEHAVELLTVAGREALDQAGVEPEQVDSIICVCSTGIATPGVEAHVAERLGLRADVERSPFFGLGCSGGVMALARAASRVDADPGHVVLVLAIELCSLTLRVGDRSLTNLIACALFGDGAIAAVVAADGLGPAIGARGEHRWPRTLAMAGWDVQDDGMRVLLDPVVQRFARQELRGVLASFLDRHGLTASSIDAHAAHPGGGRVLEALREAIGGDETVLAHSREILRTHGNMSSVTALFVLKRHLEAGGWRRALVSALGPGFTAAFTILEHGQAENER